MQILIICAVKICK